MGENQCWLIYHKAAIAVNSSLNMDSSTYAYGVAVVPERDLKLALELFEEKLKGCSMKPIEVYKCVLDRDSTAPCELDLAESVTELVRVAVSRREVLLSVIGNESFGN